MKTHPTLLFTLLTATLALPATAQKPTQGSTPEKGLWHASSKTAKSTTGDIAFSDYKVTLDFFTYTIANIRSLSPAELALAFDADPASTTTAGTLYRLDIPSTKKFLHSTTLCGTEDTQWIVTYTSGRSLQLLFFSGNDTPAFTPEAFTNNPALCGLYAYTR